MRKVPSDDLNVESLRCLGISNGKMRFVQVHVPRLHALYQRACLRCFYRAELDIVLVEIAAVVEIIYCANVLREEKVQCPVKRHTNLFVQAGQLAEVNRPPHPPREEAREIETKYPRHACPTTD